MNCHGYAQDTTPFIAHHRKCVYVFSFLMGLIWLGGIVYDATHAYDLLWDGAIALGVIAGILHLPINDERVERLAGQLAQPG